MATSLILIIGIIGNIISTLMFASPMKTFWRVVKKNSTENYKGLPYVITLLCTSLWTFYGLLKPDGLLVATVNGAGAVFQLFYVSLFLIYAPTDTKIKTAKLAAVVNVGFLGSVIALTLVALREEVKLNFVGLLCTALTIGMYASPLSVMGMVIKMKSVEYMPFLLSLFLFLNAGIWSIYAVLVKDFYIGVPNAIGFVLGSIQLVLYSMYNNKSKSSKTTLMMIKEEKGLTTLVKGGAVQMGSYNEEYVDETNLKPKILQKGKSLPKPIKRIYSMPQQIMKSLSLNSYELDSLWTYLDDDGVEMDDQKSTFILNHFVT